jgi:hypothetical protein
MFLLMVRRRRSQVYAGYACYGAVSNHEAVIFGPHPSRRAQERAPQDEEELSPNGPLGH